MVDNLDSKKPSRLDQALGDLNILRAGLRIAGRMVVCDEYRVGPVPDSLAEHVSRMDRRLADGTMRNVDRLAERP